MFKKEEEVLMDKKTIEKYRKYAMRKWDDDVSEDKYCPEECVLFGTAYGEPVGMQYLEKSTHPHNCNQIVVGPEKETEDYFIWPNLFNGKGSAVITVPDREDVREKIKECRKKGIKTHVIDFSYPETSSRYNPFLHIRENNRFNLQNRAEAFARLIEPCLSRKWNDPFCDKAQCLFLSLVVLYLLKQDDVGKRSFNGLLKTLKEICNKQKLDEENDYLADILQEYDYSENKEWSEFLKRVHIKTLREILIGFIVDFQIFDDAYSVKDCFIEEPLADNIDISKFGTEQHYLFIIGSDKKPFSDLASVSVITLFADLLSYSETSKTLELPCHVHFYLGCFINMHIPNFPTIYSIIRKYNINFSVIIENGRQLMDRYPEKEWLSITCCAGALIYLEIPEKIDKDTEEFIGSVYHDTENLEELFACMKTRSFKSGNELIAFVQDKKPILCDKMLPSAIN